MSSIDNRQLLINSDTHAMTLESYWVGSGNPFDMKEPAWTEIHFVLLISFDDLQTKIHK